MRSWPRFTLVVLACAAAALMLPGCVVSEEDEYAVTLNADGKSGAMTEVQYNLQSDQQDPAKQQEDFDELMRRWTGDAYLLERTKDGVYVKNRDLSVSGGKLVWKATSIFRDFAGLFENEMSGDTLRLRIEKDQSVVATNGTVVRTADSTVVLWPTKMTTYTLRIRHQDFHPSSDFVRAFRQRGRK